LTAPLLPALATVHAAIDACRLCESQVGEGYRKIQGLDRGDSGKIVLVGQGPGNKESEKKTAFAGPAGTTLNKWLVACGSPVDNPRRGIYQTSLIKCVAPNRTIAYRRMVANCRPFLTQQLRALLPRIIITLGEPAYQWFQEDGRPYQEALCIAFNSTTNPLLSRHGGSYIVMPWPHPSPANNAVLTESLMRERLVLSFDYLRPFFETL
jgi:DNA polymerase